MIHKILPVGLLQCNCSIFGDEGSGQAIVIDPGDEIDEILGILEQNSLKVQSIVVIHANDRELYADLDVQAAWLDMPAPERTDIDVAARDGDVIALGAAAFEVRHTPGHTQGSISLWIPAENKLIAGDTLFRDSIGRTDLPGGDGEKILRSIHEKLLTLPDDAIVFPGHGQRTTIGRERAHNPFLIRG